MKTEINKSAKRALSLVLAFAMLVGCLFTANVGVNIKADALDISDLTISYWDGTMERSAAFSKYTYDSTTGTLTGGANTVLDTSLLNETNATGTSADDPIIIDDAKELATLVRWGTYENTAGLYFKLSDKLDAIVLQPSSVVDAAELMGLSSGAETQAYFEDETRKSKLIDWGQCCDNGSFGGNFNGNGVEIYGLYTDTSINNGYGRQHAGLFGATDPGVLGSVIKTYTFNDAGVTYENIIIKNSYYFGFRRMGGIFASTNSKNYGCSASGVYNVKNCIVANCYMECTGSKGDTNDKGLVSYGVDSNGILLGSTDGEDVPIVTNCLVYGNDANNNVTTYWPESDRKAGSFCLIGNVNTYTNTSDTVQKASITNSVALGSPGCIYNYQTAANYCTNVYSTANYYSTPGVISFFEAETIKGASAIAWMPLLGWDTDWYAVEGELPTPIKPAEYISKSEAPDSLFAGGDGTKDKPYIIRSVDQLSQMVNEQSYSGTYTDEHYDYASDKNASITSYYSKYYKVADDVDALYINNVETQEEVVALVATGTYNKWAPTASFFAGNFDGNGVTIYGMVSTNGKGFVNKIDGTHAAIKNVHFKAAYVGGGNNRAAVVTTSFGSYGHGYKATEADATANKTTYFNRMTDPNGEDVNRFLIANIAVTESYIHSNLGTADDYVATAGGIISFSDTPPWLTVRNCMFDGSSSTLTDGVGTTAGASTSSMKAGIATIPHSGSTNRWEIANCVSINEYPVSMKTGGTYTRFTENSGGGSCEIGTMYGPVNDAIDLTKYPKFKAALALGLKEKYTMDDAPILDWAYTWQLVDVKFDNEGKATRTIPMPTGIATGEEVDSYSQYLSDTRHSIGQQYRGDNYFGMYYEYTTGSGTVDDPYIIESDIDLARAIACGGKNLHQKLYYKLSCDIKLTGLWLNQESLTNYTYVPFEGTIDGAGHTIIGLAATDATAAGFIPVLNGGTVKNLHFRDCYAGSNGVAGIIAGQVNSGTIVDCSVENSITAGTSKHITGNDATIINSYYYADGKQNFSSDIDSNSLTICPADNAEWYKGPDGVIRHIDAAKAHTVTDVDGDGIFNSEYTPNDLAALRNCLLGVPKYTTIYGDVNNNGATNISDLAVLRREMVGTYNTVTDGFWRNLEVGTTKIYYAENDTYDMARKLQLYLEASLENTAVTKLAGSGVTEGATPDKTYDSIPAQNAIVITKTAPTNATVENGAYGNYSVTYDSANNVLTISGGSFTAVEQAVLDLIKTDNIKNKTNFANGDVLSGSILDLKANKGSYNVGGYSFTTTEDADSYKSYRWVDKDGDGTKDDGELYYYAWGDEFESETKTTFDSSEWQLKEYRTEDETVKENDNGTFTATSTETSRYLNLESANVEHTASLWAVENGRLTINRGVNTNADNYKDGTVGITVGSDTGTGYVATPLEIGAKNDYGSYIDNEDVYVDPGDIVTTASMLFKYGYAEMRASLPSDGHAFPAWWVLTGPAQASNKGIETTLYDKIYRLNSGDNVKVADTAYDGTSNTMNGANLSTYKYQIPAAHLEFDIVELMQAGATSDTGNDYRDYFQATVHRIYTENVYGNETSDIAYDNILYIPNWTTGTSTAYGTYSVTTDGNGKITGHDVAANKSALYNPNGIENLQFFKSVKGKPYLNNYDSSKYNDLYPYASLARSGSLLGGFTYKLNSAASASFSTSLAAAGISTKTESSVLSGYYTISSGNNHFNTSKLSFNHQNLQKTYTYGFTWDADPVANTYTLGIYCDLDEDGIMEAATEKIFEVNPSTGVNSDTFGDDPLLDGNSATTHGQDDYDLWNQYGYMLLDNAFYTSVDGGKTMFTSLGVDKNTNKDKVTFDIEYVRVYQNDGKRDIVTPETEDFNNGNHFGY